ncbi:host cell division inhibitor Icd-like protein [Photorhabdus caribbeanensis]|uniref:host cell division inhibitor Icd-like protein n=1 Tax=Photorhabdus caribbeanensis TaxID=1004165 RepID=UPI001BD53ACD|nr:host cell division inhibitor Icd-like protein [Photorhabdus caribbeanensis]MBS9425981.1 host cell division inhibitor Icd-like protein [Photorhabdus caribbeanensis]
MSKSEGIPHPFPFLKAGYLIKIHPEINYRLLALSRADMTIKPYHIYVETSTELEAHRILTLHFTLSFTTHLLNREVHHV